MTSQDITAIEAPIARTPVWKNILMAPGNAVAGPVGRSTLRTTVSFVVWGLIVADVGLAGALAANGTLGAAFQSMSHRQQPHIAVAVAPRTSGTATPATPGTTQTPATNPGDTVTTVQVVTPPATPATPVATDTADPEDHPAARPRAARRPPAPNARTVATDRHAARTMRGLF